MIFFTTIYTYVQDLTIKTYKKNCVLKDSQLPQCTTRLHETSTRPVSVKPTNTHKTTLPIHGGFEETFYIAKTHATPFIIDSANPATIHNNFTKVNDYYD